MAVSTRNQKCIYLLDSYITDITGSKLPSNRQALGYFLYLHLEGKETIRQASTLTIEKVFKFWEKACIPVKHKKNAITKLEKLYNSWKNLRKHKLRCSITQQKQESEFKECLDDLFDVAHVNALNMIRIAEDKDFLLAQREKGRRGCLGKLDRSLLQKKKRHRNAVEKQHKQRRLAEEEADTSATMAILEDSCSSATEEFVSEGEEQAGPSVVSILSQKSRRKKILSPTLSASLDRANVSSRAAMYIVSETAKSLGHNINDLTLSTSSIRRSRRQHRKQFATEIMKNFSPKAPLTVHWDGKLLPDLTGHNHVDRLPILVTFQGDTQLLSVPKLPSGTGEAQARAVFDAFKDWNIEENVVAMCFDTTSSNTGRINGACVLLEQLLGRDLLYLACRHHVLELIAGAVFNKIMPSSSAPDILLFKRFKDSWEFIDQNNFKDALTDDVAADNIKGIREEMIEFITVKLTTERQPRDDYREVMELTLLFLGAPLPYVTRFRYPGANHHARWMAKVIYTFKVWMFRSQFHLTLREQRGLRELCVFFSRIYVKAWITAPLAVKAPNSDLCLLKSLKEYAAINESISKVATEKMARHLWYLSEELVGLSLFDDDVQPIIKDRMAKAIMVAEETEIPAKRATVLLDDIHTKTLATFATANTQLLFKKLKIPYAFLHLPVAEWDGNSDYQMAKDFFRSLIVTNDHAERSVALVKTFSGRLTKDEDQLQFLLQVVSQHRKSFPQASKNTLIGQQ